MTVGQRFEPYLTSKFSVVFDKELEASFTECSGLEVQTEVKEYQEGGLNDVVHRLPGRSKVSNVTLKRGIALKNNSNQLWDWYRNAVQGRIKRKNISIVLHNLQGKEVMRWNFTGAYPVKWSGPTFNAGENAVTIETLELAHEGMDFVVKT